MNYLDQRGLTYNKENCLLVAGTTSTLTTTVTGAPILDGKFNTAGTIITNAAHPTTDFNTGLAFVAMVGGNGVLNARGQGCIVVYGWITGASTLRAIQGPIASLDIQNNFEWNAPQFPAVPNNFVPFAYVVMKARAVDGLSIIVGTTAWASFAQTFVNVVMLPSRPQVA